MFPVKSPEPPFYAVTFSSILKKTDLKEYYDSLDEIFKLAQKVEGFIGEESIRDGEKGITISYWKDLESINKWRYNKNHQNIKKKGIKFWYHQYEMRIAKVDRVTSFIAP